MWADSLSRRAALAALGSSVLGAACGRRDVIEIRGAGATLPAPLYEAWAAEYESLRPSVRIDYAAVGSGGGLRQLALETVDFGASDVEPDDDERRSIGGAPIVTPVAKSALAVALCLPASASAGPVVLDLETLVAIYLGDVARWDAPAIQRLNPGRPMPALPVVPIARSDGGGSTAIFTSRLADAEPRLRERVGIGRSVVFPAAIGARGSDGVASAVASTPGAIGYVEVSHAWRAGLEIAALSRSGGPATLPTVAAVRDAAVVGSTLGYPFASYTFLVLPEQPREPRRAAVLAHFAWWVLGPGQLRLSTHAGDALASGFQPVPEALARRGRERIGAMTVDGRTLLAID